MRGGMLSVLRQDFIRTAFAKGLEPNTVYWKHAFRNSLIPIITMFASFLPAMISGAVIIEYIFTIPGMGRVSYESVVARNFPVLFTILMFSAILTMMGNLLSDVLYALVDPRISFTKKQ
jgi:peptide/nickel transport system permease protein